MKKIYLLFPAILLLTISFCQAKVNNSERELNTAPADTCAPLSTLPCSALAVALPYSLSFNASVSGTLADKNGAGTGFTVAVPYSGTRLPADGSPSVPAVPGYQPANITASGGTLKLIANKGIDYLTNNNQINILGVKVLQSGIFSIEVSLVNPINGTSSQQGGIWYGLNDHTSIKLDISGNKVELRREFNDISSNVVGTANTDQRITAAISNLNAKTVRLRLMIDSANNTAEGFYSTDNGNTYTSTGAGYPSSSINIAGMGLTGVSAYAAIYATYRNATTPATYSFQNFSVYDSPEGAASVLKFSSDSLTYTIYKSGMVASQSVNLTASVGHPSVRFTAVNAPWLVLPAAGTGTINFGSTNINTSLTPGTYKGSIIASATGYKSDTLGIRLIIVDGIATDPFYVNFSDPNTVPPTGWLRDYGQAYGPRSGLYQSTGLQYGWKKRSDGTALNITGNGFNRNTPEDVTQSTLIYMQANNLSGTFSGTKTQAYWEMRLPNGTYDINVSVGDGAVNSETQSDNLNVEGVKAISGFVPSGSAGSPSRFKQVTVRVPVSDEHLTLNADGGTDTKINIVQITPVSIAPYIGFSSTVQDLIIQKGSTTAKKFMLNVGNSANASITYSIAVTYGTGASGWLTCSTSVKGVMPLLTVDYTAANKLPIGIYTATIRAYATGYTDLYTNIQIRVIDKASPYVISATPANGTSDNDLGTLTIAANNLNVPAVTGYKGGVDNSTITNSTVQLYALIDTSSTLVQGVVQGTGGGDAISFSPLASLSPNTTYKFVITSGVKSYSGASFIPFSSTFTTGATPVDTTNKLNAQFSKTPITGTQGKNYTTLKIGPDGKLYALRLDANIERWDINHADGSLSNMQLISTITKVYGAQSAVGITFDPSSTATNLICYVSHSASGLTNAPAFSGSVSKLTGANLDTEQELLSKLPRSTRDHMSNTLAFGPDGALYLCQGSNSSAGAYDPDWQRAESLLSGTVLRIDLTKLNNLTLPLNLQTTSTQSVINAAPSNSMLMSDGTYNPYSSVSPVTIYASGVRNAFCMVWHSNGQLYLPTNGSAGGGNSPASVAGTRRPDGTFYNGPVIPATTGVQVQLDWLFRVNPLKGVGYYGHPNPLRGQYVENRGYLDNPLYATNVVADTAYRGYAYNFGLNHSPDGAIEYKSNTFNGALKNKLLVCRFSGGGDIVVMEPGSLVKVPSITATSNDKIYDIVKVTNGSANDGLVGMSGFANPLNLVEDTTNGNIYIIEYNWNNNPNLVSQITLLQVKSTNTAVKPLMAVNANKAADLDGVISYQNYDVTVANRGDGTLKIKNIVLVGPDADQFNIQGIHLPTKDSLLVIRKNSLLSFTVNTPASVTKMRSVKLRVTSIDDSVKEVLLELHPDGAINSSQMVDSIALKIGSGDTTHTMNLYPNPNSGTLLHIQLKNFKKQEEVTIYLYDMMGKKITSTVVRTDLEGGYNTAINLPKSSYVSFYIVKAIAASGSKEAKVMVNR